ncbi:MAG: hypothetical protein QOE70_3499 [Chthoniobacter sp.]|jgi:hypothetical protein|nr:hypothetical protein [Chthoniobacter sp.]
MKTAGFPEMIATRLQQGGWSVSWSQCRNAGAGWVLWLATARRGDGPQIVAHGGSLTAAFVGLYQQCGRLDLQETKA